MCGNNANAGNSNSSNTDKNVASGIQVLGTLFSAHNAVEGGNASAAELQYKAAQERSIAGQEMAAGSARIAGTDLAGKALESRMMAAAGASGVDMVSPTVVDLVSRAAGVTQLNKQMELYNAESSSNAATNQASADEFSAQQVKKASRTRAVGTILSGAASLYNNYR